MNKKNYNLLIIEYDRNFRWNDVDVKIHIFEGEKFIIERINIIGNSVTNDSVIRSEMIVDEGDPLVLTSSK